MKVTITRTEQDDFQTLGELSVPDGDYSCKTLELPWEDNARKVSCIPEGTYKVEKRNSPKFGDHFHIQNVPDRTYILIHQGNYKRDIKGCILVGQRHADIDTDGHKDVTSSRATMGKLNEILPDEFDLVITKASASA